MLNLSQKNIIGGAIGNALETYDYVIWSLFSVYLSKEFLPPNSKLSDIFLLFLISYILRPIGSLISGILADQIGRKKVLTFSIFLMGICTSIVGILPSYQKIGILSVFLLLTIRLIQVFALSSEYISSISLLIENCDKRKKGYFGSWVAFGVNTGILVSSIFGSIILYLIDMQILPEWGWRFVFTLALITMLIGFWIRNSLPESIEFISQNVRREQRTFFEILQEALHVFKNQTFDAALVFSLVCFGVSSTFLIFIYGPIHLSTINHMNNTEALVINSCSLGLLIALIPVFGWLSDRIGRARTIMMGLIPLTLCSVPYFSLLSTGTFYQVLLGQVLIAIPCANIFAVTPVLITEIFPSSVRCSITNFIYSLAACFGGGLTPLIAFKLVASNNYLPGVILVMLGIISSGLLGYSIRNNRWLKSLILVK